MAHQDRSKDVDSKKVRVRQVRSVCQRSPRNDRILDAMGLGRIGRVKELPLNDAVAGMIKKVRHLVTVEFV